MNGVTLGKLYMQDDLAYVDTVCVFVITETVTKPRVIQVSSENFEGW
jgi:hypothetical protein